LHYVWTRDLNSDTPTEDDYMTVKQCRIHCDQDRSCTGFAVDPPTSDGLGFCYLMLEEAEFSGEGDEGKCFRMKENESIPSYEVVGKGMCTFLTTVDADDVTVPVHRKLSGGSLGTCRQACEFADNCAGFNWNGDDCYLWVSGSINGVTGEDKGKYGRCRKKIVNYLRQVDVGRDHSYPWKIVGFAGGALVVAVIASSTIKSVVKNNDEEVVPLLIE